MTRRARAVKAVRLGSVLAALLALALSQQTGSVAWAVVAMAFGLVALEFRATRRR